MFKRQETIQKAGAFQKRKNPSEMTQLFDSSGREVCSNIKVLEILDDPFGLSTINIIWPVEIIYL